MLSHVFVGGEHANGGLSGLDWFVLPTNTNPSHKLEASRQLVYSPKHKPQPRMKTQMENAWFLWRGDWESTPKNVGPPGGWPDASECSWLKRTRLIVSFDHLGFQNEKLIPGIVRRRGFSFRGVL